MKELNAITKRSVKQKLNPDDAVDCNEIQLF